MGIKKENYITIQGWMISELELKGNELLVYAIIYGFSQNGESEFTGGMQYLADWTCSTKQGIQKNLKSLLEKNLITQRENLKGCYKYCAYRANKPIQQSLMESDNSSIKQSLPLHTTEFNGTIKQSLTNNINNKEDNKEIVPPDYEEAKKYYQEKQYDFGFDNWFYYYESKGWMIGKNKVKSWKATMKTWSLNRKKDTSFQSNPVKEEPKMGYKSLQDILKEEEEMLKRIKEKTGQC
jgi:DNA-binding MarR family transcriptional regulator